MNRKSFGQLIVLTDLKKAPQPSVGCKFLYLVVPYYLLSFSLLSNLQFILLSGVDIFLIILLQLSFMRCALRSHPQR